MENTNAKLFAALIGGAAVGAALAVLFAPAKGSELRESIADEAGGLVDSLTQKCHELSGTIDRVVGIYHDMTSKKSNQQ